MLNASWVFGSCFCSILRYIAKVSESIWRGRVKQVKGRICLCSDRKGFLVVMMICCNQGASVACPFELLIME